MFMLFKKLCVNVYKIKICFFIGSGVCSFCFKIFIVWWLWFNLVCVVVFKLELNCVKVFNLW